MKPTTKETIKTIMQFAISVLTALLAALGAQSCRGILRKRVKSNKQKSKRINSKLAPQKLLS